MAESNTSQKTRTRLKKPSLYKVIMHNDDYTSMQFVIDVLVSIFRKSSEEAHQLMLQVHQSGQAVVGVYALEIAETKIYLVHQKAQKAGFPLKCSLEKE